MAERKCHIYLLLPSSSGLCVMRGSVELGMRKKNNPHVHPWKWVSFQTSDNIRGTSLKNGQHNKNYNVLLNFSLLSTCLHSVKIHEWVSLKKYLFFFIRQVFFIGEVKSRKFTKNVQLCRGILFQRLREIWGKFYSNAGLVQNLHYLFNRSIDS